jgi:hypothetical protein
MIPEDRAERIDDVVAVEKRAPGVAEVVSFGGSYIVDARGDGCMCKDKEYNLNPGERCKHHAAALLAFSDDLPAPFTVTDNLNNRVATDGGQSMFTVIDHDNDGNERTAETRAEAEQMKQTAEEFGSDNVEIVPPGEEPETDGGDVEVVEHVEPDAETEAETVEAAQELPERDVGTDPLTWMPGEFVDEIDDSQAINRKGFEVLAHFYDVDVAADLEVPPEDTEHEYCRVKATATIDGRVVESYGSAHVDRGDDKTLLLEMADTRARKRALSIATGAGAVAVEELRNEVDR